jgi:SAM-dependent methyltransferase
VAVRRLYFRTEYSLPRTSFDPQGFWDQFNTECSALANLLERQFQRPRRHRRGVNGLLLQFDRHCSRLRNTLRQMERSQSQRLKDPAAQEVKSADVRFLRLLHRRLTLMQRIYDAMALIQTGKARALYAPPPPVLDLERVRQEAMDRTMLCLHRVVNPNTQSDLAKDAGCYADIPLSCQEFLAHCHAAFRVALAQKRPRPLRFLDVGCGGGIKVLLAAEIFDNSHGFDLDPAYVEAAEAMLSQLDAPHCEVSQGDALRFEDYGAYDVIYFYQPMSDDTQLEVLEARIVEHARPGTILIAPYLRWFQRAEALNCGRVEGAIYLAKTAQGDADRLRGFAEQIGPQITARASVIRCHGVDWLRRLAQACAANGYVVV